MKKTLDKTNLDKMIKNLEDHFYRKIFAGEFELINHGLHTAEIKIDDYLFSVWISNSPENCGFYRHYEPARSERHAKIMRTRLDPKLDNLKREKEIKKLEEKIKSLKGENSAI
jgi:hypothetical protein